MLQLSDEISAFIERKIPLLRIHKYDGIKCTCGKPECQWDAKKGGNAGKHPAEARGVHSARVVQNASLFEGFNVGVACGRGFVVLDIDPRNGGDRALAELIAANGPLPRTWQVATGGGGTHYYFSVEGEQRSGKRVGGIDLVGLGGYVLAAGSLHPSGRSYEWVVHPSECDMAPLPEWVRDACVRVGISHEVGQVEEPELYSREEVLSMLKAIDPSCPRETWWRVGAGLKTAGFSMEMWDEWSKGSDKYHPEEIKTEWDSYKIGMIKFGTVKHFAEEYGWAPEQTEKWDFAALKPEPEPKPQRPKMDIQFPQKMFGNFARAIYENATDKSKLFSIAAAHTTCAILAQIQYLSPTYGVLGAFQFIVAEAGEGKNEYTTAVKNTLKAVALRLGFEKNPFKLKQPKSSHYIKNTLNRFNCGALVLDEGLRWFYDISTSSAASDVEICRDILSSWSGAELEGFGTKDEENSTDALDSPRITIFGGGTFDVLKRFFMDASLSSSDGTLSRLNFIPADMEEAKTVLRNPPFQPSQEIVEWLCAPLLKLTQKPHVDPERQSVSSHINTSEQRVVGWENAVRESFDALGLACKPLAKKEHGNHTWNRHAEMTLRFASVIAVFDNNAVIDWDGFEYAKKWQLFLTNNKEQYCEQYLGKTKESICREKILEALKREGGRCSRKRVAVWWRGWSATEERIRQAAIDGLERDGVIEIELSNAKRNRGEQILKIASRGVAASR